MSRIKTPGAALALLLVSLALPAAAAGPPIPEGSTYVAMGSSYASGPGITHEAADGLKPCSQSNDNYARQLARLRKLKLIDRSCSGAVTADILTGGRQAGLPPQLDGLTPDTRLVTVTIGGNDVRYTADLGVDACAHRAAETPGAAAHCPQPPAGFNMDEAFAQMGANLKAIIAQVHMRSPKARLVIVDYITVLPTGAPCAALSLSADEKEGLRKRAERLATLTAQIAAASGVDLIKTSELARGHDACAADAWVQGYVLKAKPTDWNPVAFHPLLAAHTAIAQALDRKLRE